MKESLRAVAIVRNLRVGGKRQDDELCKAHRISVLPIISGFVFPLCLCLSPLVQNSFQLLMVTSFCSGLINSCNEVAFFPQYPKYYLAASMKEQGFCVIPKAWQVCNL